MREMEEKTARAESTDEDRGSTGGRDEALARLQMALTTAEDTAAARYLRQRIGAWNGVDESISYNGARFEPAMYYTYFIHFRICTCMPTLVSYVCPPHRAQIYTTRDYAYTIIHVCPSISP